MSDVQFCSRAGGRRATSIHGIAHLREGADASSTVDSHIQFGEDVVVVGRVGDWYECFAEYGNYQRRGFIHVGELGFSAPQVTHRIKVQTAPLLSYSFSRAQVWDRLPKDSAVRVIGEDRFHYHVWPRGAVFKAHVETVEPYTEDFLTNVKRLVGTPFVWGGRTVLGLDCAGLVQLAMRLSGRPCPRAKIDFLDFFGPPVIDQPPVAGDILVLPRHCAIFTGPDRLINASASIGEVVEETLEAFQSYLLCEGYETDFVLLRPGPVQPSTFSSAEPIEWA